MNQIIYVDRVVKESNNVSSIYFKWDQEIKPGQFTMVWVPGVGEIPLSLSKLGNEKCITIKEFGPTSGALFRMKPGDAFRIRGPYGRPFKVVNGKKLVIGGGSGMASLRTLIDENTYGIIAGKTASDLLFLNEFRDGNVIGVTEDGSTEVKGFAYEGLSKVNLSDFDMIYVCGPELMMKSIYDRLLGKYENVQFSLERHMKCGIGICDSCSVNGFQVCRDGPTFFINELREMSEFGRTRLLVSGRRIYF